VGLVVEYGVGPGYRSVLFGLYRGVSCRTGPKKQLKLGRPGNSVKGDGGPERTDKAVRTVKPVNRFTAFRLHNLRPVISFDTGSRLEDAR
jgi:hypothetical protein